MRDLVVFTNNFLDEFRETTKITLMKSSPWVQIRIRGLPNVKEVLTAYSSESERKAFDNTKF
jgi:hypothetical protein